MKTKIFIKHILFSAILITATSFVTAAQASKEVIELQKSFSESILRSDWKALETFCHEDLIYTHSFGRVDTKADFLLNIAKLKVELWENETPTVKIYKNTAIVRSNLKVKLVRPDGEVQISQQRATQVWLLAKKKWLLVSHQSTSFQ